MLISSPGVVYYLAVSLFHLKTAKVEKGDFRCSGQVLQSDYVTVQGEHREMTLLIHPDSKTNPVTLPFCQKMRCFLRDEVVQQFLLKKLANI